MEFNEKAPGKGSGGRRRRRRRRRGGGGGGGGSNNNRNQNNKKTVQLDPGDCRQWAGKPGRSAQKGNETLTPFNLFCAYHLGITADEGYSFQSLSEVARRFNSDANTVKKRLADYGLETKDLEKLGFEAKYAQMDIQVAPEGVSRRALAQTMWADIEPHLPEPPPEPVVEEPVAESTEDAETLVDAPETEMTAEEDVTADVEETDGSSEETPVLETASVESEPQTDTPQ